MPACSARSATRTGRDDGAHAGGLQRTHAGLGILGPVVAELGNAGAEQRVELGQVRRGMVKRHQPDARRAARLRQFPRAGQRLQQIEAAHLDHDHGNVDMLAHPGTTGAGGHQGVYGLDRLQRAHGLHGVVKGRADMLHTHLVAHRQGHALQHAADAMAAYGDDTGPCRAGAGTGFQGQGPRLIHSCNRLFHSCNIAPHESSSRFRSILLRTENCIQINDLQ